MNTELLIALTFDLDPDSYDPSIAIDGRRSPWRGVEEGVPMLVDALSRLNGSDGSPAQATWFVRVDDQIEDLLGDQGALLDRYGGLFGDLAARGDEIAWHPHLDRRNGAEGWFEERDAQRLRTIMANAHAAMLRRGVVPAAARIGGNYGSNDIMAVLDDLGVEFDSTAMPGRKRNDRNYRFDWEPSPAVPYRPSKADYRRPGEPARAVTEVPLSMVAVKAAYDTRPLPRYVDLSFHPEALRDGLAERLPRIDLLVTVTHPSTLLSGIADREHGLLSFDFAAFERNLAFVLGECERQGRPYRLVTLSNGARARAPRPQ